MDTLRADVALPVTPTRDHLATIGGITLYGRLFMQVRRASYDNAAVVGILGVLLRKLSFREDSGDLGWLAHPSWTRGEDFLKCVELGNVCGRNLEHLLGLSWVEVASQEADGSFPDKLCCLGMIEIGGKRDEALPR